MNANELHNAAASNESVAEVFRTHAGLVERVLRRAGVPERDLNDLRQEVFIIVHRKLGQFEGRSSVSTWLYRIALHVASDHRRRAYQRRERLAENESAEQGGAHELGLGPNAAHDPCAQHAVADPTIGLEQRELLTHVLQALASLDADKREAFVLSELFELPMREVASRLGCPAKTAFSRTYAARRRILAELHKQGALPLWPLFFPLRALGGLRSAPAAQAALAPASALGPLGWIATGASACLLVLALGWHGAAVHGHMIAELSHALPANPVPATATVVATAAQVVAPAPAAASAARRASAAGHGTASAQHSVSAQATARIVAARPSPITAPQASAAPAAEPDDMQVVRASAVDLRPQLVSPLAPALPEPRSAPARIQVHGPNDAADGVENALGSF